MAPEVRLSGPNNEPLGIVSLSEALRLNPSSLDHDEWADVIRKGS